MKVLLRRVPALFLILFLIRLQTGTAISFPGSSLLQKLWDFSSMKGYYQGNHVSGPKDSDIKTHWALLVAGSNGWWNYRHQSDVCHAYHVLTRGGFDKDHIVLMIYDDLAKNPINPHPGKIFNKPGGPDVYEGVAVDYSGADVNAHNFLAVLEGDARAMRGVGTGRTIASGPRDRVFVFYSDHGSAGVLGMPSGSFLFADDLISTLARKKAQHGFKEMVMYIEACESGSMFEGLLGETLGVYVATASNPFESSWGTYCPGVDPPAPDEFSTCLGDLFSVSWMEDADSANLTRETLHQQFLTVAKRTSDNFTYSMGSHAQQYGRVAIDHEVVANFEGTGSAEPPALTSFLTMGQEASSGLIDLRPTTTTTVRQRDADLLSLRHAAADERVHPDLRATLRTQLSTELSSRRLIDSAVSRVASALLLGPETGEVLMQNVGQQLSVAAGFTLGLHLGDNRLGGRTSFSQALISSPLDRPAPGIPLVDNWDCLKGMVAEWEHACGPLGQYGMRHTRFFANLCNTGIAPAGLAWALEQAPCSRLPSSEDAAVEVV